MTRTPPTFATLEGIVRDSGLWGPDWPTDSHRFRLAPQSYVITAQQRAELDSLAASLYRTLHGVSRLMAIAADLRLHRAGDAYAKLATWLGTNAPYHALSGFGGDMPVVCKTDLVLGRDGHIWLAEADAVNPRSWGHAQVRRLLAEAIDPNAGRFEGVIDFLVRELRQRKVSDITFLYGDAQRFYSRELAVVAHHLGAHGIAMTVISETEIRMTSDGPVDTRTERKLSRTFVDMPLMNVNSGFINWMKQAVRERSVKFLIPPKYFLSSKVTLAVISNPTGEAEIEGLLQTQIDPADLSIVRRHLPATHLIHPDTARQEVDHIFAAGPHVLKLGFASGTKGVWLSSDPRVGAALSRALMPGAGYSVLQQEVDQRPTSWLVYPEDGLGPATESSDWFVRLTGYTTRTGMADVAVTARQGTGLVHGNPDAIQAGVIIG